MKPLTRHPAIPLLRVGLLGLWSCSTTSRPFSRTIGELRSRTTSRHSRRVDPPLPNLTPSHLKTPDAP
jgi:hypothetical protein